MSETRFVAPCLLGLEGLVADELRMMDAPAVQAENGRVFFGGDDAMLARANLNSRFAERIQIVLGQFEATSFDALFEQVKRLPWEKYIGKWDAFPVKGWSLNSKLYSIPDCQSIIKKAVVERLKAHYHLSWFEETGPLHQIQFSLMKDQATLMLDTSGVGLHKRGYRPAAAEAPIKETLAAAIVKLARVRPGTTLYDPFCGSGTLLIEGCLQALRMAPGLNRAFAAEKWSSIPASVWQEERHRALSLIRKEAEFAAYGSDIDETALALSRENAKRAGVNAYIQWQKADIRDFTMPTESGIVVCNPPYGERLLDLQTAEALYQEMGKVFTPQKGKSYYIMTADELFEKWMGRRADKRRKLYNGNIKCQLYMYFR